MLSRQDKQEKIERLTRRLEGAGILIIAENRGVSAGEMDVFRRQFSESDGTVQVVKNTLARLVLKDGAFAALDGHLRGPLVYGVGADASLVAKKFADMARDNPNLVIVGGALPFGEFMSGERIDRLAKLPSREVLLGQLLGTMQAPISGFVRTLSAVPTGLVRALSRIRDGK